MNRLQLEDLPWSVGVQMAKRIKEWRYGDLQAYCDALSSELSEEDAGRLVQCMLDSDPSAIKKTSERTRRIIP